MTRVLYIEDNNDSVYMLKLRFELLESSKYWSPTTVKRGAQWRFLSDLISSLWASTCLWWTGGKRHTG